MAKLTTIWRKASANLPGRERTSLLATKQVLNKRQGLMFIAIFAIGGISLLIATRAATLPVAFEPETGVLAAGATSVANANASGGRVLAFAGAATPTPTPAPASISMLNPLIYGTGIGYDTKANIPIGESGQKMAIRFKSTTTSALNSVKFVQRGNNGNYYSLGSGGTTTLTVQADDGSGHPNGTALATTSYTCPSNPSSNWETYAAPAFSSPATLTAGKIYYIVFTNPSTSNWISVNSVYAYNSVTPRQPIFSDAEFGVMYTTGAWGGINQGYTPVVDLAYANGTHAGQAYYEAMIDKFGTISGGGMVREVFTVSGGNRTIQKAGLRVRRGSGSSPLVLTLETSGGSVLATASSSNSTSISATSPGGDNGGSVWATVTFSAPITLTNGTSYSLRASAASGTTYYSHPIRSGTPPGFLTGQDFNSYSFRDGSGSGGGGQYTTGSGWSALYAYAPQDLQFYLSQ